jgi:7,8-dihydro-6-hydroxymethylpterin-pyrophosphokinase
MHERRFVLEPLAEIGGAVIDARSGRTISEILMSLP